MFIVQVERQAHHLATESLTAIRTDATVAARYDRTHPTIASHDVTRIDIIKTALGGPAHPEAATVTDPALLTSITGGVQQPRRRLRAHPS
jgi:hypothetical protein